MRLKFLNLSGFKSFVDTGKFEFPSNLVGIVGPNGCGKSNSIDAVRWVMGERSAKNLRGENMSDVIFNGSKTRNSIGKASVEMLFDNSQGRITGQYAAYNEISVKRTVSRDGFADYFLNNTKVRRRDVMDLFSGTGLGPRSYAIIEQGLISRFVEAKPEDTRSMIEEAAGVSQYKDRRRDTENRIKHTRENLDRIQDLLDEITKNINRLRRQAKTAEKYKDLKQQQKSTNNQILSINWLLQSEMVEQWQDNIQAKKTEVEVERARFHTNQSKVEALYQKQVTVMDVFNRAQEKYYTNSNQVTEFEQKAQEYEKQLRQIKADLEQNNLSQTDNDLAEDQTKIEQISQWLQQNQATFDDLKLRQKLLTEKQTQDEIALDQFQKNRQEIDKQTANANETIGVETLKLEHLSQQITTLESRARDLNQEITQLPKDDLKTDQLESEYQQNLPVLNKLQQDKTKQKQEIQANKANILAVNKTLNQLQQSYQETKGKLASLITLQQNLLTKPNLVQWLDDNNLSDNKRLAENLKIEDSWHLACEIVLGEYLQAICLDEQDFPNDFNVDSNTILLKKPKGSTTVKNSQPTLADKVTTDYPIVDMLAEVLIANTFAEALLVQKSLKDQQSVVCKQGIWLGKNWLKILAKDTDNNKNILQIDSQIKNLEGQSQEMVTKINEIEQAKAKLEHGLINIENSLDEFNQEFNQIEGLNIKLQAELNAMQSSNNQTKNRKLQIQKEQQNIGNEIEQLKAKQSQTMQNLTKLEVESIELLKLQDSQNKLQSLKENLNIAKQNYADTSQQLQQLSLQFESKKSQLEATKTHLVRLEQHLKNATVRLKTLQERKLEINQQLPNIKQKIQQLVSTQVVEAKNLEKVKQDAALIEHEYRTQNSFGDKLGKLIEQLQTELNEFEVAAQESIVGLKNTNQNLSQSDFDYEKFLEEVGDETSAIDIEDYRLKAEEINHKILTLGEINFAAIKEFKSESERKVYIEEQVLDLKTTLDTLETAIRKIDKETRDRFKETYDLVNVGLQKLFPELFGGGRAYLELTSDNLLDAGVTIMAQPPGKRNSTIHLLSGGEKALTAVALVFAIFELNPAPFCMLDEVDASLDDANVVRLCSLVKKMSDKVQFIFITHNKITMELARQLYGVTMNEPGVSRLVAVDVEKAVELVNY